MTSSNALRRNKKYVLMNNLGNEHSLVMKFDWFIPIYKKKILSKISMKNVVCKLVPGFFMFIKN